MNGDSAEGFAAVDCVTGVAKGPGVRNNTANGGGGCVGSSVGVGGDADGTCFERVEAFGRPIRGGVEGGGGGEPANSSTDSTSSVGVVVAMTAIPIPLLIPTVGLAMRKPASKSRGWAGGLEEAALSRILWGATALMGAVAAVTVSGADSVPEGSSGLGGE